MGFFTFIESFFFLSLGITFVLIFLMVFHFKQRVEQLEQKNEIVLEAYNDIVKQINILNTVCVSSNAYQPSNVTKQNLSENITFSTSSPIPIYNTPLTNTLPYPKIKVEDFEEEEDEEEEEEEEEEDEEEDEDEEDEEEAEKEEEEKVELQSEELFSNEENLDQENTSLEMEEIEIKTEEEIKEGFQEEVKIEEEVKTEEEEKITVVQNELETEDTEDDIKKMNVQQLRNLVTIKGLLNDASKTKRPELIRLLTSNKPANTTTSLPDSSLLL